MTWHPPYGSPEVEPGYYLAPNGSLYQDPGAHEAERARVIHLNRERAKREHEQRVKRYPCVIAELTEECLQLEMQVYVQQVGLEAMAQLLNETVERLRFEEGLVASLLDEATPRIRHLREAA